MSSVVPNQPSSDPGGALSLDIWLAVLFAVVAVVFAIDLLTPLGYALWALYMIPIAMTIFQRQPKLPLIITALATIATIIGLFLSPEGLSIVNAAINRSMATAANWSLAFALYRALSTRNAMRRVLWLQAGEATVSSSLVGEQSAESVGQHALKTLADTLGAEVGALYRLESNQLQRLATHAVDPARIPETLSLDQGIAGEVARSGQARVVRNLASEHLPVVSATGSSQSPTLLIAPMRTDGRTTGIIELGFLQPLRPDEDMLALLDEVAEPVGVALRSALYRQQLMTLLDETQRQSVELQAQQEELRVANEELESQASALESSQSRLEMQQQSLEESNVRLETQTRELQRQKADLEASRNDLQATARQLETASRYKSEFLANMSHELRTPLNSALILSKLLGDNVEGTLSAEQVRYAQAIHAANNDLLTLINDILDLSKIESGHVELEVLPMTVESLVSDLRMTFEPLASQKGLTLDLRVAPDAPTTITSDRQRLQQVLKNLLSNAIKFTETGSVTLTIRGVPDHPDRVGFEVEDTGIGIAPEQQRVIFEAFRQADGSTSRRFGGTGLGLSISRELARLLGGDISVTSTPGRGSRFSFDMPRVTQVSADAHPQRVDTRPPPSTEPQTMPSTGPAAPAPARPWANSAPAISQASTAPVGVTPATAAAPSPAAGAGMPTPLRPGDGRRILAVEDDARFAAVLVDLARELDFETVIASSAAEALRIAQEGGINAILLDIGLPDASGLSVLEQLKRDPNLRHIPVHMISAHDRVRTALELGAIGYLLKPANREAVHLAISQLEQRLTQQACKVLVVEDDPSLRENLGKLLGGDQVEVITVGRIADALEQLSANRFDCVVMDLALPDGSGYDLLERLAEQDRDALPPIIVYTGRALNREDEQRLRRYSRSIIIKGARSPERLLDEVTLFLHRVESSLPDEQRRMLRQAARRDSVLDGRRLLLAEDDVRNIFALTSVFEPLGAKLEIARNGREAIERLQQGDIDLVLMDIMMPEMDGLEAMRRIRAREEWRQLPIIALTANAMPDDRRRCLEAGANDYIAKPIDIDKLVSLTRVWCPR